MNGDSMGHDRPQIRKIDCEGHRTGALARTKMPVLYDRCTIEMIDAYRAQIALQRFHHCPLRSPEGSSDFMKIG